MIKSSVWLLFLLVQGFSFVAAQSVISPFVHDPSRIIKEGNAYFAYSTGNDIPMITSTDRIHWTSGPSVLKNGIPAWAKKAGPLNNGHDIWAPDLVLHNGLYYLYYAINGGHTSAIGLVTSPTLDPKAPNYNWTDRGEVIGNIDSDRFSAIDPCPYFDAAGDMWLSWGSGYIFQATEPEIFEIRLNKATGLRSGTDKSPIANGHIEASYVYLHGGYYYAFWNSGGCCDGVKSTYEIHVARSSTVTGPYKNKAGDTNSSNILLASYDDVHGPGQIGFLVEGITTYFSVHYYNAKGNCLLGIGEMTWDSEGWPVATKLM